MAFRISGCGSRRSRAAAVCAGTARCGTTAPWDTGRGDAEADDAANAGIEMLAAAAASDIPIVAIDFLTVGSLRGVHYLDVSVCELVKSEGITLLSMLS